MALKTVAELDALRLRYEIEVDGRARQHGHEIAPFTIAQPGVSRSACGRCGATVVVTARATDGRKHIEGTVTVFGCPG